MAIEERWHFQGDYTGVFRLTQRGVTHAGVFHDIKWSALEIRNVKRIEKRDAFREKVGDYHYQESMRPKHRWRIGGVDLVIVKDDQKAFSEPIYDVVLLQHSGERKGFSPFRDFAHAKTNEKEYLVNGVVYFSLPADPPPPPVIISPTPIQAQIVSIPAATTYGAGEPSNSQVIATDSATLQNRSGCLPKASGCLNTGGCLTGIFRSLRWLLFLFLAVKLIGWVSELLSEQVFEQQQQETGKGSVRSEKPRLDPKQDTLAVQPWNYLVDHHVNWYDFAARNFDAHYSTSTYEFAVSTKRHRAWANSRVTDELLFYHDLYEDLYSLDKTKLDSLAAYFSNEQKAKSMDQLSVAEMVVTFIQEIPYVLVHDGSCNQAAAGGGFVADYHARRMPCQPNVVAGIHSPYEFAHTMQGDCDTRSLLAFTILDRLGIGASVWVSRQYGHSILGVAVPANSSNFKRVGGNRHFATELTVKGFRVGMIAPEHTDMDNWNIVLNN